MLFCHFNWIFKFLNIYLLFIYYYLFIISQKVDLLLLLRTLFDYYRILPYYLLEKKQR